MPRSTRQDPEARPAREAPRAARVPSLVDPRVVRCVARLVEDATSGLDLGSWIASPDDGGDGRAD